ncbi:hypothetical protein MHU86_20426 [Fragilaria crotonensis]|nr:hypothetical protein MHU86_20426 [Fragilaria crotonensis]
MVKGNWQRRIEQVEARKIVSKQMRQKRDNRANFKAMVSNLIKVMDVHRVPNGTLHIWTEAMPVTSSPGGTPSTEVDDCVSNTRQGRPSRSGSLGETLTKSRKQPDEGGRGKKAHPRSRGSNLVEELDQSQSSSNTNAARCLCKTQFYRGQCDGTKRAGKKSSSCRLLHYAEEHKTLGQIITPDQNETLDRVEKALDAFLHDDKEDPLDGMDMIYYLPINLSKARGNDDDEIPPLGRVMSQALSLMTCSNASIVADDDTSTTHEEDSVVLAALMPGAILEFILSFLPDEAVASMTRVCSAWHNEIGKSSSHLWQNLLDRRKWPRCDSAAANESDDEAQRSFKMHYEVVRDVHAVRDALVGIINPQLAVEEVDMVYHLRQKRKADTSDACVGMAMWSPTEVLVAYESDCSIRLFKAVGKGAGGGRTCREVINVCFDPRRNVTKVQSSLRAMALGDTKIIALTNSVPTTPPSSRCYRLSIVSRDEYLSAAGNTMSGRAWSELDEGALTIINIEEMIINSMETDDSMVHQGDFDVELSHTIVDCGKDKFLLQACVRFRGHEAGSRNSFTCSKYVVFSSLSCTIVSMFSGTHSYPWNGDDVMMMGLRRSSGGRQTGCRAVSVGTEPYAIEFLEIDASGRIVIVDRNDAAEIVLALWVQRTFGPAWEIDNSKPRLVTLVENAVVTADVLTGESNDYCSFISLYALEEAHEDEFGSTTKVFEGCIIVKMQRMRDKYLLLLCFEIDTELDSDFVLEVELENRNRRVSASAIILHISTLDVISRVSLPLDESTIMSSWSLLSSGPTLCVGVEGMGVVMTGRDIRAVNDRHLLTNLKENAESNSDKEKKKKKRTRLTSGSGKKDGFARGMRQSG